MDFFFLEVQILEVQFNDQCFGTDNSLSEYLLDNPALAPVHLSYPKVCCMCSSHKHHYTLRECLLNILHINTSTSHLSEGLLAPIASPVAPPNIGTCWLLLSMDELGISDGTAVTSWR